MTYLIILLVIALALAPLFHFAPSKRQRRVAHLREYAAVHGLFVEFRNTPGTPEQRRLEGRPSGDIIYYGKRLPPAKGTGWVSASWVLGSNGWRSVGKRLPAPAQLLDLGEQIIAASVDQSSCGVYWVESSGEEGVEEIRQSLEQWSEELLR
jgi:hypothetical protein